MTFGQLIYNLVAAMKNTGGTALRTELTGSRTGVGISATQTRPDNATPYAALDVVGADAAANLTFAGVGVAGQLVAILGAMLEIGVAAVPAGMAGFRLHLYSAAPTAITDNLAYDLPAGDRAKHLGWVDITTPVDLGATIWAQVDGVNHTVLLAGTALYGILVTVGAYTPSALTVKKITLNVAPV